MLFIVLKYAKVLPYFAQRMAGRMIVHFLASVMLVISLHCLACVIFAVAGLKF